MKLSTDQIGQIVQSVSKAHKKANQNRKESALPEYSSTYKETVKLASEVAVHSECGKFPDKLLKDKAPNEDPKEFEYRKGIYQQRTLPYWNKALTTINRIWNPQNYAVIWKTNDDISESAQEFFEKEFPNHENVISYFQSVVTPYKIKDPNAVILISPEKIPTKSTFDDAGNEILVIDDTQLIEPEACIYPSENVMIFEDDYVVIKSYDKSEVKNGNTVVKEGIIFYITDESVIYKVKQVGIKKDFEFTFEEYYRHDLGYIPAQRLKGKPVEKDGEQYYHSYFMDAVPYLNISVCNGSTLDMSVYAHAFPERWEYVEDCPGEQGFPCINGQCGDSDNLHQCSTCKGSGKLYKHSPLGVFEIKEGGKFDNPNSQVPIPPFGYVAPEISILEFLKKQIDDDIKSAFSFLNIDVSTSNVSGPQDTALGKKIDREELFASIMTISNELFDTLKFVIKTSGEMRYGQSFESPTIKKPHDFSIRSESDLTEELSTAKTAGLPDLAVRKMIKSLMDLRFNTSQDVNRIVDIIMTVDRIATMSSLDINANISTGRVAKWEAILHDSISSFIEEKINADEKYLDQDLSVIKADLIASAKTLEKEINAPAFSTAAIISQPPAA